MMYVYIYIYIYNNIYVYVFIHMYIYTFVYTHTCIYICIYIFTYLCMHVYIHTYIYVYIYMYSYIYREIMLFSGKPMGRSILISNMYTYKYMYIFIYIYIYIYIYARSVGAPLSRSFCVLFFVFQSQNVVFLKFTSEFDMPWGYRDSLVGTVQISSTIWYQGVPRWT